MSKRHCSEWQLLCHSAALISLWVSYQDMCQCEPFLNGLWALMDHTGLAWSLEEVLRVCGLQTLKPTLMCISHESCFEAEAPFPNLSEVTNSSLLSSMTCFDSSTTTESPGRLLLSWHTCQRAAGAVFSNASFSSLISDGDVSLEVLLLLNLLWLLSLWHMEIHKSQ